MNHVGFIPVAEATNGMVAISQVDGDFWWASGVKVSPEDIPNIVPCLGRSMCNQCSHFKYCPAQPDRAGKLRRRIEDALRKTATEKQLTKIASVLGVKQ